MRFAHNRFLAVLAACLVAGVGLPHHGFAQVSPAAGHASPDDTPALKVGATIFADYTYNSSPATLDADSNRIHLNAFNVSRAYINITGNISHLVGFRITPDITRETGAGSSLNGSLTFRLKYAFGQLNLDGLSKGSWVRLGIQQTPWIDFEEGIYRYRFQGTVFSEREGFLSSADAGASFHYNLPSNFGDLHAGVYNGETYSKAEANNQKAIQVRGTLRPFATAAPLLRGLRATVFYDGDHYLADAARSRLIGALTFEHAYLNAGFEYLTARDRTRRTSPEIEGKGFSVWATPKTTSGLEALLRYDHFTPNTLQEDQTRNRFLGGIAYWFPHQGNVSSALMLDYEAATFDNFTPAAPDQRKIALHALINF
ncbi:MAG TPA: hypothetical protein VF021_04125 [Longimicrobiales bacterium]